MNPAQMNNPYLAPDNVNKVMNMIQQNLPGIQFDLQALVNFMQQVNNKYPMQPGTDPNGHMNQLNQFTVKSLYNHFNPNGPQNNPGNMNGNMNNNNPYNDVSPDAQEMGRLVDQLRRERNYNNSQHPAMPPQRNFADNQVSNEEMLDNLKNKIQSEKQINKNLGGGGTITSVNLNEVIGTNAPPPITNQISTPIPPGGDTGTGSGYNSGFNLDNAGRLPSQMNGNFNHGSGLVLGMGGIGNNLPVQYLSLDFRTDLVDIDHQEYMLKFPKITGVKGVGLVSVNLLKQPILAYQPYLYITLKSRDIPDLNNQIRTGKRGNNFFGKLIPANVHGDNSPYITYKLENSSGQVNSYFGGKSFDMSNLYIGFYDYQGQPIDLKKINANQILRIDKNQIKIGIPGHHNLQVGESILITQKKDSCYQAHSNRILNIPDKNTIITQYQSSTLNGLTLYRKTVPGHLTLVVNV